MKNQNKPISIGQLATLNDLALAHAVSATHNQAVVDEFYRRYGMLIKQEAHRACSNNYDHDLIDELDKDALSEAHIATDKALKDFNGSSPLGAYLRCKIRFHFAELLRENAKHSEREAVTSRLDEDDDDDEKIVAKGCKADRREAPVAMAIAKQYDRQKEAVDCYNRLLSYTKPGKQLNCLKLMLKAYRMGEKSPIQYAAKELDCTRQQVYHYLRALKEAIPPAVQKDMLTLFK